MIFYLSFIFLITFLGGFLPLVFPESRKALSAAVAFAAGLLLGTALFKLLPGSMKIMGANTGWPILIGFGIFYIPQKFVLIHPCEEEDCDFHTLGILAFIGMAFHAAVDGIGVGAVKGMPEVKSVVAAVAIHKLPASLALSFLLLAAGLSRRNILAFITLFGLATPAGALLADSFLQGAKPTWLGWALGISAGNFLAIAGSDMLGRIHEKKQYGKLRPMLFLFSGIGVSLIK